MKQLIQDALILCEMINKMEGSSQAAIDINLVANKLHQDMVRFSEIESREELLRPGYSPCQSDLNYEKLDSVLHRAYEQASEGKGKERHAQDLPFHKQPMLKLCELYGPGFALGQAAKKSQESLRLTGTDRKVHELLGAINYIAGAIIHLEKSDEK